MMFSLFFLLGSVFGRRTIVQETTEMDFKLFDFTKDADVTGWVESSDTVREVGMSKAALVPQKTQVFNRVVFFTLLNPQPNGAGFAGMNFHSNWNLTNYNSIDLRVRGQGQNVGYKMVLRHKNQNKEPYPTYEQTFTVPINFFEEINLPISDFKPYYRGRQLNESDVGPLDRSFVTSIGLQVYGGVYLPVKQSGVSSLEIDWIKALR